MIEFYLKNEDITNFEEKVWKDHYIQNVKICIITIGVMAGIDLAKRVFVHNFRYDNKAPK